MGAEPIPRPIGGGATWGLYILERTMDIFISVIINFHRRVDLTLSNFFSRPKGWILSTLISDREFNSDMKSAISLAIFSILRLMTITYSIDILNNWLYIKLECKI